ncbi:hypothetical protein RB8064 [Rhodopirellula baltica SH 1]|uniref:Uncharacterized protein n=1 Tax=Rhodopirellula baltica (strain DSM 10527 / NCIMB 13988 / SH1) TaxID=243090 RepID=Q7UG82_RHOBA|nr:hypothetical protein RB8064 [Rhodopirellula baltica SH 1]
MPKGHESGGVHCVQTTGYRLQSLRDKACENLHPWRINALTASHSQRFLHTSNKRTALAHCFFVFCRGTVPTS